MYQLTPLISKMYFGWFNYLGCHGFDPLQRAVVFRDNPERFFCPEEAGGNGVMRQLRHFRGNACFRCIGRQCRHCFPPMLTKIHIKSVHPNTINDVT